MKEMLPDILNLVGTLVGLILMIVLKKGRDYLIAKMGNDKFAVIINKVEMSLETIIKNNQETLVKGLKQDLADNKITKEEFLNRMVEVKNQTIKQVGEIVGTEGLKVLDGFYGDSKQYLQHRIEAMVGDLKKN